MSRDEEVVCAEMCNKPPSAVLRKCRNGVCFEIRILSIYRPGQFFISVTLIVAHLDVGAVIELKSCVCLKKPRSDVHDAVKRYTSWRQRSV